MADRMADFLHQQRERVVAGHYPVGDGFNCACGYDFFGGSAAYSIQLYEEHLAGVRRQRFPWLPRRMRWRGWPRAW